jgi:secreted PhoX family phosphatase
MSRKEQRMASPFTSFSGSLEPADANGLRLPRGFTSRVVARSGKRPIRGRRYVWHPAPDGGATFATRDSGWIYVSNSEIGGRGGGAGALKFDRRGRLVSAYSILRKTDRNCAGGPTPWGTWLSCEEVPRGFVWECDPFRRRVPVRRDALGVFTHEAAAVDPLRHHVYMTEDERYGCFYRFTPDRVIRGIPDLSTGTLHVAEVLGGAVGPVKWHRVPDPSASTVRTREQVSASTRFTSGEGCYYHRGTVYFATKGDNRVWAYDTATGLLTIVYDAAFFLRAELTGVDNIVVSPDGQILVAEDGGDMQIVAISPTGRVKVLLQIEGHPGSEVTGPAFDPSGTRLYFSSQRGKTGLDGDGVTYEVRAPRTVI